MALSAADDAAEEAALAAEEAALAAEEAALEAEEAALANELARMKAQDKVCRHFSNLEFVRSCLPALAISHPCVHLLVRWALHSPIQALAAAKARAHASGQYVPSESTATSESGDSEWGELGVNDVHVQLALPAPPPAAARARHRAE